MVKLYKILLLGLLLTACHGQQDSLNSFSPALVGPPETPFTIHDPSQLIGGPIATGRMGDVLLENDKIRVIIEQPGKTPWVANFGGGIVDADLVRESGVGEDNFGFMHPIINIEWSVNVYNYEVVADGKDGGPKILRTYGAIDVFDYLDLDFLSPIAKAITGQTLYYDSQFDDATDPFNLTELRSVNTNVMTDYILEPGTNYVRIETTFENLGGEDTTFLVGDFVNGSGQVMFLVPGMGFTPEMTPQIQGNTPALIYVGFEGTNVSYGYFYDISDFVEVKEDGTRKLLKSTSLSYSGVTGIILGEEFLKVLPLGGKAQPKINFTIPAGGRKTVTRYLVVGNGSGGSVFDAGLNVLGIATNKVSGIVRGANGTPVPGATVAVKTYDEENPDKKGATIITYRTDANGRFEGQLSAGISVEDKAFGSGKYSVAVYKNGHMIRGTTDSGVCSPNVIDVRFGPQPPIECELGKSGIVKLSGVIDAKTGEKIPARLTVVGYTPNYRSETGGDFEDGIIFERPPGVVELYYVNGNGTIGVEEKDSFRLAPGKYELVFTRGTEYSMTRVPIDIVDESIQDIGTIKLDKVIDTSGFISADFHLHSIVSPDSAMHPVRRVLAAAGEGMDVVQSSDHDFVLDYAPYVDDLSKRGLLGRVAIVTVAGDEVSPNHMGHFNFFPLKADTTRPCGGALDWGYSPSDGFGPGPDIIMSPQEQVDYARNLPWRPIVQVNHIADLPTSLLILTGWVTTPFYYESHGVEPLSSYADPALYRLVQSVSGVNRPYKYGTSPMVVTDFDTLELVIGPELHDNLLLTSTLPTWFNFLNLGLFYTATGDSDSHREIGNPLGIPRNFVASNQDPADGLGSPDGFNWGEYIAAIRGHKVIVSTGPFIRPFATNESGESVSVGSQITGGKIHFQVKVDSPEWAWFDTIEIYSNTEPIPASDDKYIPLEGAALDPTEFFGPYHIPRYYYEPTKSFSLKDGTLSDWRQEDGVIKASVEFDMVFDRDAWVVVFVRGTEGTEGYRSLFPFVTHALVDPDNPSSLPENMDMGNLNMLSLTGAPAWAFTNPIFIDIDGAGFEALLSSQWRVNSSNIQYLGPEETEGEKATTPPSASEINKKLLH